MSFLFNKKKYVFYLLAFLFSFGFEWEISNYSNLDITTKAYIDLFMGIGILFIYIIPLAILIIGLTKKWNVRIELIILVLIVSIFIPGWLAYFGNNCLDNLLNFVFGSDTKLDVWFPAITAPIVEESIKGLLVLMIVYLLGTNEKKVFFLIGFTVGFGFQISEDIAYILLDLNNEKSVIPQAFIRLSGSSTSHWLLTAIFTSGIYCFMNNQKFKVRWLIIPLILHFLLNSPMEEFEQLSVLMFPLISTWALVELLYCYNYMVVNE